MSRPVCPRCHAPVLPVRTPLGEELLLSPEPLDDIFTIHQYIDGLANRMPKGITRRVHRCQPKA